MAKLSILCFLKPDLTAPYAAGVGLSIALLLAVLLGAASQAVAAELPAVEAVTYDGAKVTPHEFIGDVRHLPLALPAQAPAEQPYRPLLRPPVSPKIPPAAAATERTAATISGPLAPMPSPVLSFAGMSRTDTCTGGTCGGGIPPDPNGDVGPNHYIQAVNSAYAIYNKTGTLLASFTENQLWAGAGTLCNTNSRGDPVVLYDALADRWILTHLAFASNSGPFFQCIAASKTSDPVSGGWWLYALRMDPGGAGMPPVGALNDYPKFGIWHDCLYMGANEFNIAVNPETYMGVAFASFSRSDLYSGAVLTWSLGFINTTLDPFTMIPSNLSGQAAASVPPGTPNYFVSESQTAFAFEVRKFTPGPNCGGGGSLSAATNVSQTPYPITFGTNFGNVVPQPNTTNKLDNIDDRIMQKVQYRKIGGAESLWVTHNVGIGSGPTAMTAMQWAQIDVTGGTIVTTPVQQQIYAPDATLWRWMGSLAVDNQGNMALGYSTSNGSSPNFPSIAYAGRLASDPPGTLPQTEVQLVPGSGSQTNTCGGAPCHRWGDYTAMSVDPADDCTFWYTNQYYNSPANGATGNWQTRIGSFKFPSCVPSGTLPDLVVTALTAPSTGTIGGQITISTTVGNQGTASAGPYRLGHYFSADATITTGDTLSGFCNSTGLAPGASQTCSGLVTIPSSLSPGTYSFGAFADDLGTVGESNEGNNTATAQITLSAPATTTTLASSANPAPAGTNVTLTATVMGANPTGSVNFAENNVSLTGCNAVALAGSGNSRTADCSVSSLSVGSHTIVATYGGDSGNAGSSGSVSQVISGLVRIAETLINYSAIQPAYAAAVSGNTIQAQAGVFQENLVFGNPVSITLKGGYDSTYTTNTGSTVVSGSLTISNGTVVIDNIVIK